MALRGDCCDPVIGREPKDHRLGGAREPCSSGGGPVGGWVATSQIGPHASTISTESVRGAVVCTIASIEGVLRMGGCGAVFATGVALTTQPHSGRSAFSGACSSQQLCSAFSATGWCIGHSDLQRLRAHAPAPDNVPTKRRSVASKYRVAFDSRILTILPSITFDSCNWCRENHGRQNRSTRLIDHGSEFPRPLLILEDRFQ